MEMVAGRRKMMEKDTQTYIGRLYERLKAETPGYEWNETDAPFHSSFDNFHISGFLHDRSRRSSRGSTTSSSKETQAAEKQEAFPVVARVSRHTVRLEREYKLAEKLKAEDDPECKHFVDPVQFLRMPARLPGEHTLVAFIIRAPGLNYLKELVEFGPSFQRTSPPTTPVSPGAVVKTPGHDTFARVPMHLFLDFAVGAAECCEILHHGKELVHGEIRTDCFHFSQEDRTVRLINFGSGARSFENGLTSTGWTSLAAEAGVEHKLQFIAPEQTGRMPAEPDTRTDIYSLGILFWSMLTGEPAYDGDSPLEIMQALLSRRVPAVDSKRTDVPHVLSIIIQKMTQKSMDDRYQSSAGLKYDLQEVRRLLSEGDPRAVDAFRPGEKDVSCFFHLPNGQIGRQEQRKRIADVIEAAASRAFQAAPISQKGLFSLSSHSSTTPSAERLENGQLDETGSVSSNSVDRELARQPSGVETPTYDSLKKHHERQSQDTVISNGIGELLEPKPSHESRASLHTMNSHDGSSMPSGASIYTSPDGSVLRTAQRLKKRGNTEIISISGTAGLGKSSLLQTAQTTARKHGYYASAKFDQVKKAPYEPVLRVMSSLFRQIFSENDVNTDFHNNIRAYIKPHWSILSDYLDLPSWLLSQFPSNATQFSPSSGQTSRQKCGASGNTAADWLRAGGSNSSNSNRFVHTYIEVLRLLALQKFFVLCFDDLQFADQESLDLLLHLVKAHIPVVLVLTFRSEDTLPPKVQALLEKTTKIELKPFTEEETAEYVASTLHRPAAVVATLAAVIQQVTYGNPFFVREMLDVCYRKACIYYSWRTSQWEFDLDKVFIEFSSSNTDEFSSNDFLHRRLQDLPPASRCVLRWASLIGNTFSFNLVKHAMDCECSQSVPHELLPPDSHDPVSGLQGAITAYIIIATDTEDRFRFSHDRYLQAAEMLCEPFDKAEMHFVIAVAMMKHTPYDRSTKTTKVLFDQARHACNAIEVIKKRREGATAPFRDLLYQAAETAREQGARSVSLFFFQHCLLLLPDDPWDQSLVDVSYQETLTLLTNAAAAYWYLGFFDEAGTILHEIFQHAKNPADKTPAFIIQSRMHAQQGDSKTAFLSMKQALVDLGISITNTTWEECDKEFRRLMPLIKVTDQQLLAAREESNLDYATVTIGAVMVEMISAAYWSDGLLFYYLTLKMVQIYIERGLFPQLSVGLVHIAAIAAGRFEMIEYAVDLGNTAMKLFDCFDTDSYTLGRGLTLHALFLGHFTTDIKDQLPALERGMEATIVAGDRILHLLNLGVVAAYQLWSSYDYQEISAFITYQFETFPHWPKDLRGGVILTSVQQFIRAMQGKTNWRSAETIFDDEEHSSKAYVEHIRSHATAPTRPLFFYDSYRIAALFRFGYYNEAIQLGDSVTSTIGEVYSLRHTYYDWFYVALSLMARVRENPNASNNEVTLARARRYYKKIQRASRMDATNFNTWLNVLGAEIADSEQRYLDAGTSFEAALDSAILNGSMSEEALSYELYGEFLMRRGSTRPARSMIQDAVSSYQRISALGKAQQISEKHAFLLRGTRALLTVDAGTQTLENDNISYNLAQNEANLETETSADRTQNYLNKQEQEPEQSMHGGLSGFSAIGLDMIDLASILESSQLLSSELRVDKLLSKLTEIIVESTGAGLCGIVVNEEAVGWCVAAVSGSDNTASFEENINQPIEKINDAVAKQVTVYVLRFKEEVFLQNVLDDERFGNVPDVWRQMRPEGKAMIALPILHGNENTLLGSIFIEGPPNSFTQRNLTVLRLLVNQISISIANALLFKRLEKVSASNLSMLEIQKQALAQAREAERKAKVAEAKAMEMVRLKEEAAKAKSMFLANVSHELRTPLNGVIGMSELLKGTTLNSEQIGFADSIRVCADTLLSVINDILDFSKLEAGKMQMFNVQLSLSETITEVVRALRYTNMERGLQTLEELEVDPNSLVMGDPVRLHQIFMNLLSNAYKFTAKGTVTVKAVIDEEDEDSMLVTCSVRDTGIGIPEEQRVKLFQPFSQADSSTARSYGGTGLGLSICKAIIENVLNGRIWMESIPGVGTTVSFQLRFQKVTKESVSVPRADPMAMFGSNTSDGHPHAATTALSSIPREELRICIAEDNPINQKIAISFVKKLGFKCEAYNDGQQAVDALVKASKDGNPFHLVLMDVQMPVLDGYHATREIRRQTDPIVRDVLVIAMTASAIRGDREKCLEAGMNNYLAKPVRAHVLKQMLEGYLNQAPKEIPGLQQEANKLAKNIIKQVQTDDRSAPVGSDIKSDTSNGNIKAPHPGNTVLPSRTRQ